ncbi:hypothetical protein Xcel_3411 (plasmid) [Xylanimonas cellulosilytica DSM 15894]|uniref:Uncharacterized protein n=1 Tax=Xylanimonas cellulosilytica (strain DSM 15894 / JCM 12276 / CECT 5975 / KCTC 9989 / LMG 20990 / NBRC 107835 / XIL07) TaxID=446471 RepID=D1C0U4_XYLCX|nr:hypothetical protein [Xylanimonas cellulosilytica]ACZ32410.1 hypothetical protein Xcel_3411 [Xylanimonas cellulosilytica DSM 15894]
MAEQPLAGFPISNTRGPRSSLDRVRQTIDSLGLAVREVRADGFMAACPAHGDKTPSLHVSWVRGQRGGSVLFHCHASCETQDVIAALGLSWQDLFDEPLPVRERGFERVGRSTASRRAGQRRGRLGRLPEPIVMHPGVDESAVDHQWVEVARYPYVTLDGTLVQEVIREECTAEGTKHKNFPQVWVGRDGRRVKTRPRDFQPVLYRAPQVAKAIAAGVEVWVLEGEKDVETAERLGLVATTNTQGGKSFPADLVPSLGGAKIAVVLDRDATGWARGVDLHAKLTDVGSRVRLLLPDVAEAKADFTDHVEAGHGVDDFIEVSVELVQIWHELESELARARAKAKSLAQAIDEARARWDLAEAGTDVEDNRRFARRWVMETEIRQEALADLAGKVQAHGVRAGAEWAAAALTEVDRLLTEGTDAARRVHNDLSIAVPGALRPRDAAGVTPLKLVPAPAATPDDERESLQPSSGARTDAPVFRVIGDGIYQWEPERSSRRRSDDWDDEEEPGKLKQLLSMVVRVVAREYLEGEEHDDIDTAQLLGRSTTGRKRAAAPRTLTAVRLQYTDPDSGELMEIRVAADQWRDHSWLESLPGRPDYDHKRAGLDTLQRAILAISDDVVDEVLHRSTGWRQGPDGTHRYIHARGAITADGHQDVEVSFTGPISRFDLPDPTRDPQALRDAWLNCSATMLDRFPGRIAAPLLGHVFRSVMGGNKWNLALIGSPGTYKTSIAAKVMHHLGERWDHNTPLSSMSGNGATFNALRLTLHKAKDALGWLDDFAPTKSWLDAQKLLEETSRLIHNTEQRPRSSRDGQDVLPGTAPRTSGLFTSEVMPRPGSSGGERMLVVPLARGDVERELLFPLDAPLSRHGRALVMASFISWLAADFLGRRTHYLAIADEYADTLVADAGETVRQAAAIANTWIGWVAMCDFLLDLGAITIEERTATLERVDEHLHEAGRAAVDPDIPRTTGARVRELLGYALRQGIAYVDDVRTGDNPPWPLAGRLGWRRTCVAEAADNLPARYRLDRGGIRLGYVLHDPGPKERRGRILMCEPSQVEAVIKAAGATQVEKLEIDWKTAARALYDEGTLLGDATSESGRVRLTLKCRIYAEGIDARMAVLDLDQIIGDDEDDQDDGQPGAGPTDGPSDGGLDDAPRGPGGRRIPGLTPVDPQIVDAATGGRQAGHDVTPTNHRDLPGSDQPHEETEMTNPTATAAVCVECGYPTNTTWRDRPLHVSCWTQLLTTGVLADGTEQPTATDQAAAVPAPQPAAAAPAATPTTKATTPARSAAAKSSKTGPAAAGFRAAAAVVDLDGIWLSNGEQMPWFTSGPPTHVGQLMLLAHHLNLGTQTTKYLSAGPQVWVGADLARHMGIDVASIEAAEEKDRDKVAHEVTANAAAITDAIDKGYSLGGDGKSLGRWTRVWKGTAKSVWLVLLPAMTRDAASVALMSGDPDHATLAKRIGLLADQLGAPYHLSPSSTGLDLMKALRRKDHERFFSVTEPIEPATIGNLETETNWCRKPDGDELEHQWVHAYDRSGSYLAGVSGLELGVGEPIHHPEGTAFVPRLPGYWKIEVPESGDWRMPNPLDWRGKSAGRTRWMTTPALEFALEQEYAPTILEAWTWPEHARVLDPWYERIRDARTALDTDDIDAQAARDQLKQIYAHTIGMLGSGTYREGKEGYRPDWRHHIVAKARTNVLRRVATIGRDSGRWPVAIATDTVLYTSNEADPVKAWPGGPKTLGRELGRYKPEGSVPLAEHLQYLAGGTYTGRDKIVDARDGAE